jgi:dTDP-4-amino-4,6-dideoxygalactose transaminase
VVLAEIARLIDTGTFTNGPQVTAFESAYASFCGRSACIGVASGLDALRLALIAWGLEAGDEVILPANTFVATAEAVTQAGGVPVLVDAADTDYNIDPQAVGAAVGPRTRFLVPVHLYGQLADMQALGAVADRNDLRVIEDACQAHGAARDGVRAGEAGDAGAFSFYPGKNLGAFGDAGAIVTDSPEVDSQLRSLREHGQTAKYIHQRPGWTSRLDTIQAITLLAKLPHLSRWNDERRSAAAFYIDRLTGLGDLVMPPVPAGSDPVWHLFVVRTARPDSLAAYLGEFGIATGRHYPQPIHLTNAFSHLNAVGGSFPVAEALAGECLSLPIYPGISEAQLENVCSTVERFFAHG